MSHEMGNFGVFPNLTTTIADLNASLNLRTSNRSINNAVSSINQKHM